MLLEVPSNIAYWIGDRDYIDLRMTIGKNAHPCLLLLVILIGNAADRQFAGE